jgi:hypothetical protein
MIRIDDHTAVDLDQLAANHYIFLNPTKAPRRGQVTGDYKAKSLIGRIKTQQAISVAAHIPEQIAFWKYLLDNDEAKLRGIVTGRPAQLKALITEISGLFTNALFCLSNSYTDASLTDFGKMVASAFAYEAMYRSKDQCVDTFRRLELEYCPYCNITGVECIRYIPALSNAMKQKALHQLDHFYPQSRHPYLALSFFNLIPGCPYCNGQLKLEMDFDTDTHFNPYQSRLDDHFEFTVNTVTPAKKEDLVFSYQHKNGSTYSDRALVDFAVMERYNQRHQKAIYTMISHLRLYAPAITRSAMLQVPGVYDTELAALDSRLEYGGVPQKQKDINHYALGKLKRDICLEIGVL